MSFEQIALLVVGLIVIAAVAGMVAWATASAIESRTVGGEPSWTGPREYEFGPPDHRDGAPLFPAIGRPSAALITPTSTRQVARVVAFLYLASVAVVVAITRAWTANEPAIFSLLAVGTLLVALFMDLVPPEAMGRWRRPAEGIGAIVFLALLMALTGGAASPFLVGFYLVVAGTALSTEGRAPLVIALVAAATVALVGIIDSLDAPLGAQELAWAGFNAVAFILLADVATAAARAQRHARDEALRASRFDALTGLYNRAFFLTTMEQEIRRSDRMGRGFTMLMLDLDDLKPVNDRFGHQSGDRLLRAVGETIRQTVRFTDAAARYGGDEFVVLLPETDAAGGYVVGEKLRRDIAAMTLHAADRRVRSTVSVGLVNYPDDGTTIEQLVEAADVAMYESKRRGKNRIVGYQTRTERVATAIDIESGETLQVPPAQEARTGGDPAPWGTPASQADPPEPPPLAQTPDRPMGTTATTDADASAGDASAGNTSARDGSAPDATPGTADKGARQADRLWLTRTDDSRTPPGPSPSGRTLTPDQARAAGAPPQRPAADLRSGHRPTSRSDEIRDGGDRPWISLPIEPWEQPDRPAS